MTSYWLPRQHPRSTKRPSKLQLLQIIGKTKSVTYRFYFFVQMLPKFFNLLESMTKSYLVEFKIHRKMAYYSLQKIVLDRFPRNFFIYSAIVNDECMQKIKIGHCAKFRDRDNFFRRFYFRFARFYANIFTSGVLHALLLIEV